MEAHPSDDNNIKTKQIPDWIKCKMAVPEEVAQEPLTEQPAVIDLTQLRVRPRPPRQEPFAPAIGGIHRGIWKLSRYELLILVASFTMLVPLPAVMLMTKHNPLENISIQTTAAASVTPPEPMPQQEMGYAANVYIPDMTVVVKPRQQTGLGNQDTLPLQGVELVGTYSNSTLMFGELQRLWPASLDIRLTILQTERGCSRGLGENRHCAFDVRVYFAKQQK